jgi:hypothetical protein
MKTVSNPRKSAQIRVIRVQLLEIAAFRFTPLAMTDSSENCDYDYDCDCDCDCKLQKVRDLYRAVIKTGDYIIGKFLATVIEGI